MANTLNTGSLETLTPGNSLLVQAIEVANGKIQLEIAERLEGGSQSNNVLGMFNKSDERFSSGGARRAWLTCEPSDASELLGVDVSSDYTTDERGRSVKALNILNPAVGDVVLHVQVNETTEPSEYQAMNVETAAKRRGKDGDFITHQGMYIFANTIAVSGEATHTFLESDAPATTGGIIAAQNVNVETGEILS
jgi:hypothetical protein